MTPLTGVAEQLGDGMPESPTPAENIILLSEEDFAKGARVHAAEGAGEEDPAAPSGNRASGSEPAQPEWLADVERLKEAGGIPEKPLRYRFVKRAFDIAFSSCVIAVGLIPGLVLSAFIVADTKGSPIYTSTRVGRNGVPFRILKFRSMVADADDLEKYFTSEQLDEWHREHKVDDDPRITKLGAFLRSSSIDEFPQFINVLFGQMSTIGSRAVTAEEAEYYGEGKDFVLSMRPGITGLWQTGPRNIATYETGLRQKLELMYAEKASLKLDVRLFFKTFKTMKEQTGR